MRISPRDPAPPHPRDDEGVPAGLRGQTKALLGPEAATVLDDPRWASVLRSETLGETAAELGGLRGGARLARWYASSADPPGKDVGGAHTPTLRSGSMLPQ